MTGTSSLNPIVHIQGVDLLTFVYPAQKTHCQETRTTKSSTAQKGPFCHRGPEHTSLNRAPTTYLGTTTEPRNLDIVYVYTTWLHSFDYCCKNENK